MGSWAHRLMYHIGPQCPAKTDSREAQFDLCARIVLVWWSKPVNYPVTSSDMVYHMTSLSNTKHMLSTLLIKSLFGTQNDTTAVWSVNKLTLYYYITWNPGLLLPEK